jgi:hypothetical protein
MAEIHRKVSFKGGVIGERFFPMTLLKRSILHMFTVGQLRDSCLEVRVVCLTNLAENLHTSVSAKKSGVDESAKYSGVKRAFVEDGAVIESM